MIIVGYRLGIPLVWFGRAQLAEHPSSEKARTTEADGSPRTIPTHELAGLTKIEAAFEPASADAT